MEREDILQTINDHYKKLKKHSKKMIKDFDVEEIHKFRVEYKKLRAFLRMISQDIGNSPEIKISKKLKKSYHIAGSLRDLQLHQKRISNSIQEGNKKPRAYLNLLKKETKRLQPELADSFCEYLVNEDKKNTETSVPNEFGFNRFEDFASKKWTNIYNIIAGRLYSDDNIHAIRKNLKDLFYNLKIYERNNDKLSSSGILKGKSESYFDKLLQELGNFQDNSIAISLLKSYWLDNLNIYERELLRSMKYTWLKEKKNMKRSLIKKLEIEFDSKVMNLPIQLLSVNR